jgi:phosphatidylglycerol:prolipoprotein diacylglycerol transferase
MYPKIKINEYIEFEMFPIFLALGILFMLLFIIFQFKKLQIENKVLFDILSIIALSLGVAFLSGVFFDALFHSLEEGKFVYGGMTYIGGFIGGILVFCLILKLFYKVSNKKLIYYLNIIIPSIVLAHIFGRIGCFFGGCCYGSPTDSIFGVVFPEGSLAALEYGYPQKVFPTQLFEAVSLLIIFVLLLRLKNYRFPLYLILYGLFRFFIEFLRGDSRGSVKLFISPSQFLSLLMIISGLLMSVIMYKRQRLN